MYSIVVLEARDPKSSCQLGHSPSKTLGRIIPCLFQLLVEATNPWHPLPRAPLPRSLPLWSHGLLPVGLPPHPLPSFFNSFFNWRRVALRCCAGFCCITVWISYHKHIHPLPPKPCSPPRSSRDPERGSLGVRLLSAQRSIAHTLMVYVNATLSSSRSLLLQLYPQVHSPIWVSIPALQMGASVPFF